MAAKLDGHFNVLYRGREGLSAHEFIVDLRPFKASAGIVEEDVAKRLQVRRQMLLLHKNNSGDGAEEGSICYFGSRVFSRETGQVYVEANLTLQNSILFGAEECHLGQ